MTDSSCNKTNAAHTLYNGCSAESRWTAHIYNSISNVSQCTVQYCDGKTTLLESEMAEKTEKVQAYCLW